MIKNAVILMSAIVPTEGHKSLVEFALQFMKAKYNNENYHVHLIIGGRSFEPFSTALRVDWFEREFKDSKEHLIVHGYQDDSALQNPHSTNDFNFWSFWKHTIIEIINVKMIDYVFGSEPYGIQVSDFLNAEFIPYDLNRDIYNFSGTKTRQHLIRSFNDLMHTTQNDLRLSVTIFGQESVGKTTLTKALASKFHFAMFQPEWARPYLELIGSEITDKKMETIAYGQYAMMQSIKEENNISPFIFHDTDLLSTIGYWRIYKGKEPEYLKELFLKSKSDLYIMMNDNIPFEKDILRYGGDKRESTMQFWIDLLKEFDCEFVVMKNSDKYKQVDEAKQYVEDLFMKKYKKLILFQRD